MSKFQGLSTSEKILLAQELWDSALEKETDIQVTDSQKKILDERLAAYHLDKAQGDTWDVVKKRVLDRE
jgi:putative addiction module component (TIGR02574 family)